MGNPFGKMTTTGGGDQQSKGVTSGFNQFLNNGLSQGLFADANSALLQGRIGDPTSLSQYFQQGGNGSTNLSPVNSQYSTPQFQGFNPTMPQLGAPDNGMASLMQAYSSYNPSMINQQYQGVGPFGLQLANPNQLPGRENNPNADFTVGLGSSANVGSAGSADVLGQHSQAVQDVLSRQVTNDVADLRQRYSMGGNSNLGTGSAFAEGNYRAAALPQVATALGQINQQERGLNLQQRGQDIQNFGIGRNADVSQLGVISQNQLGNTGFGVEQRGQDINSILSGLGLNNQSILGARGQDIQSNQFGANLGFQQQAQNQQNQLSSAAQMLQAQGININALLQNQAQGNQQGQAYRGLDNSAMSAWNQLMSQNNQFQNNFNQQNSQFGANFGQQGQALNNQFGLQNQGQMNQFSLGMGNLGANLQGQQLQAQQQAMAQMFQAYLANQGLNTPQAQSTYKPGWVGQVAQLASAGAQIATPFMGNLQTPQQFQLPTPVSINPALLPNPQMPQINTNPYYRP